MLYSSLHMHAMAHVGARRVDLCKMLVLLCVSWQQIMGGAFYTTRYTEVQIQASHNKQACLYISTETRCSSALQKFSFTEVQRVLRQLCS